MSFFFRGRGTGNRLALYYFRWHWACLLLFTVKKYATFWMLTIYGENCSIMYVCFFHMLATLFFSYLLEVIIFDIDYAIPFFGVIFCLSHRPKFQIIVGFWFDLKYESDHECKSKKFVFLFFRSLLHIQYSSIETDFSEWSHNLACGFRYARR